MKNRITCVRHYRSQRTTPVWFRDSTKPISLWIAQFLHKFIFPQRFLKGLCFVQGFSLDQDFFFSFLSDSNSQYCIFCDTSFMYSNGREKLNWIKLNLPNAMSHFYNNVFRSTGCGSVAYTLCTLTTLMVYTRSWSTEPGLRFLSAYYTLTT